MWRGCLLILITDVGVGHPSEVGIATQLTEQRRNLPAAAGPCQQIAMGSLLLLLMALHGRVEATVHRFVRLSSQETLFFRT